VLWPARVANASGLDLETPGDLSGFYLIGISEEDASCHTGALTRIMESFQGDIQTHARYFEPSEAYIHTSFVRRSQLGNITVDGYQWQDGGFDTMSDSSAEDEPQDESPQEKAARKKKSEKKSKSKTSSNPQKQYPKLRTSSDVYNRLMWDPSSNKEDYAIGYEDRFTGVKEMHLTSWKREVEDEAFIPFHRVVHFRRRSDNVVVWDRRKRIDLVFGSGTGPS